MCVCLSLCVVCEFEIGEILTMAHLRRNFPSSLHGIHTYYGGHIDLNSINRIITYLYAVRRYMYISSYVQANDNKNIKKCRLQNACHSNFNSLVW